MKVNWKSSENESVSARTLRLSGERHPLISAYTQAAKSFQNERQTSKIKDREIAAEV